MLERYEQLQREPSYSERFPEWRASDGGLKEKQDHVTAQDGGGRAAQSLTGYESSEEERRRHDEPQQLWELHNAYGSLAVGKNKKKQLMIVNSQRRTKELPALTPESKALRRETSQKIPLITEEFRFNEDWNRREESAYSLQLDASRSPDYLMRKMQELGEARQLDVRDRINPFFDTGKDKAELGYLQEKAAALSRGSKQSQDAERGMRIRIQFLRSALADKERERNRFYTKLPQLLEEARKEKAGDWMVYRPWLGAWEAEAGDEQDENGGDDGTNGDE